MNESIFGLCDDQDGGKAYTNFDDHSKWIATVKNDNKLNLTFTAIDKCVIKDDEEPGRGRCDCMLTSTEHLYFVELKVVSKGWLTDAIGQLESTIKFFNEFHTTSFKHKKAFVCNKSHRHFQEIDNEFNLRFFKNYGFRIDVQAQIIMV